jgi:glycosyltransferase involved in cell wall biosynthesis
MSAVPGKKLRIALIGPAHPLRGGIADFNEALARSLAQEGHSVSVFSFYLQYPGLLFPGKTQLAEGPPPAGLDIDASLSSINPISWWNTSRKIDAIMPDLVIIRYWLPFMAPSLGTVARNLRKKGIPVLAITDNVLPHEKRFGDTALTRYFVRSCDGFITMSRAVLHDLSQFTDTVNKLFLPHPVYDIFGDAIDKSEARSRLGLPAEERWILFFGFIRKYKGLDILLEALADQRMKSANVKLLVAGEFYEDEKVYHDQIERLGLQDRVRLDSSFISKEKIKDYFCAADIIVQPYRTATQSGITQIAYHFGRPMLVTDVGGLSEIVDDQQSGYVVPVDPSAIAAALADFYEAGRESKMSASVRAASSRFSWKTFVQSLVKFYEQVR